MLSLRDELGRCVLYGTSAPHHPETQESIVRHTHTYGSAFEEVSDGVRLLIALGFQIITLLGLACILACVLTGAVCPIPWVEGEAMHGRR